MDTNNMEQKLLEQFISNGLSARSIAKQTNKSLTTIRYWLKKHNLNTDFHSFKSIEYSQQNKITDREVRICPSCKELLSISKFHNRRNQDGTSTYCKVCTTQQTVKRQKAFKQSCIEYAGGKCVFCGYNKCVSALEFHHVNPDQKDFSISNVKKLKFDFIIKEEIDKCLLLCANCHREEHERIYFLKVNQ